MLNFIGQHPILGWVREEVLDHLGLHQYTQVYEVYAHKIHKGITIDFEENRITIGYAHKTDYLRGLGLVAEKLKLEDFSSVEQTPLFDSVGVMLDCSRNAVVNSETVKKFIRYIAVMGYRTLQLYTEDTYELGEYPYFGYMRGSYSKEELKALDQYGAAYGIELVPCIQTLAHLGATLRWKAFEEVSDTEAILLVGEEKTYELIEAMVKTSAECFESRRLNIGMDEAHQLGLGKYLRDNGYENRLQIMMSHLERVNAICEKYEFEPMMWSDMFFRLLSASGDYDADCDLGSHEILRRLPESMQIVYWDYYNKEKSHYDALISQHQKLSNPLIFAGGAWRWRGVVPDNSFSLYVSRQALESCKQHGVKEVFVTAWGDNGGEGSTFAILPSLVQYSEFCYEGKEDRDLLKQRFETFAHGQWEDFILLDKGNHPPDNPEPGRCSVNPTKYLFFQDPLLGLFDKHVAVNETNSFYRELEEAVNQAMARNEAWSYLFEPIKEVYKVLSLKAELGVQMKGFYDQGDKESLRRLMEELDELIESVKVYHQTFRKQWLKENKRSGLEVQDQRIGGLVMRLEMTKETLGCYLKGELDKIEELEYERRYFDCRTEEGPLSTIGAWWHEIVTPNRMGRT